ncbi:MAG TPA: hypothetical protein VIU64_14335 [Polyangia bacterium]
MTSTKGTGTRAPLGRGCPGSTNRSLLRLAIESSPAGAKARELMCIAYSDWMRDLHQKEAHRVGLSVETAQDANQDFFLKKILNPTLLRSAYKSPGGLRKLFAKAVKNQIKDFQRKEYAWRRRTAQSPRTHVGDDDGAGGECRDPQVADPRPNPEDRLQQARLLDLIDRIYARLHAYYVQLGQEPLYLALQDHMPGRVPERTYEEIAPILGITPREVSFKKYKMKEKYEEFRTSEWRRMGFPLEELTEGRRGR